MNPKAYIVAAVVCTSIVSAFAAPYPVEGSDAPSGKSRAEVLADLDAYRASGLAELDSRNSVDWTSPQYEMARRIYFGLIQSDSFKQHVVAIAKQRGEAPVSTASSDTLAVVK